MVVDRHPMLPLSSETALRLVARPRTVSLPFAACQASATAFMVVVLPVPAGPMMALTRCGSSNA